MIETASWETVDSVPVIRPGEVHLWWQDLYTRNLPPDLQETLLSDRERARAARFLVDNARREYSAARSVLKILLSRYLDRAPDELAFRYGPLGKPSLPADEDGREICFNYTDSEGFALYAFAREQELGVDLEMRSRQGGFRRIIERRFAPRESAVLLALPEETQRRQFLACWTRKEAYGKALGLGIRYPFDCLELCEDCSTTPLSVHDHVDGAAWDIHQFHPSERFVAALVHPSGPIRQRFFRLRDIL